MEEEAVVKKKLRHRRTSRRPLRRNAKGIDPHEMRTGIEHEQEHTDDPAEAAAIACDHLREMPDYYTRLKAMEARAERGVQPNRRARPIGDRPSMDTKHFGEDLDDETLDALGGTNGTHVDAAMKRYSVFHAKDPIRVAELDHDIPSKWVAVGDALAVMYRTDKWKSYGTDEDYKHLHDKGDNKPYEVRKGVRFFEPSSEATRSKVHGAPKVSVGRPQRLPVAIPKAITLLGYCLGAFVRRDDTGEEYEINPRGCYLYSSPKGDLLFIYSPDEQPDGSSGFLGAMSGGRLRVLKDGIDG